MALKKDMLAPDEQVVLHLRTHLKSLIGAILILFLASALLTISLVWLPEQVKPWGIWVLVIVFAAVIVWLVIKPWLLWLTSTYTVTNRRIITRTGILNKTTSRCAASTTSTPRARCWTGCSVAAP